MTEYLITFVGDTSFGENYQAQLDGEHLIESKGRAYSLQGVSPLLIESNLVIVNLETPLTSQKHSPLEGSKKYIHWSDPIESPKVLQQHNIKAVSLANNHALDFGAEALPETLNSLKENEIEWFGAGATAADARRPYKKKIVFGDKIVPLVIIGAFEYRPIYKNQYNFYAKKSLAGVNRLGVKRISDQITQLKNKAPESFVIVYPHWGTNYKWQTSEQTRIARALTDAGADLIIGHGAHMLGGIERMGVTWTLYSLGNFVFNSHGGYGKHNAPPYSLIACLSLQAKAGVISSLLKLYPILTDNQRTAYQSRPVNEAEITEVAELLQHHSPSVPNEIFKWKHDYFGYYFELLMG
ncbi:MAG: CapA family protein [Nitrosomonas sp.]|nr:CapA family protein [Nitrosomonas sp.]